MQILNFIDKERGTYMQKKISSQLIHEGQVITLTIDQVQIENGQIVSRNVIHHHGGVGVLLIQNHKILMVKQYRYPTGKSLLEIPAGKLELGEDPYVCGLRELEEETGYGCEKMIKFSTFYTTPGFCNEIIHLYEAVHPYQIEHPKAMDEDECIETEWYDIDEAYRMIQAGAIEDGKTIIAIQYAKLKEK